jgi:hypothetical protein
MVVDQYGATGLSLTWWWTSMVQQAYPSHGGGPVWCNRPIPHMVVDQCGEAGFSSTYRSTSVLPPPATLTVLLLLDLL